MSTGGGHGRDRGHRNTPLNLTGARCGATTPDCGAELTKDQWIGVLAGSQDLGVAHIGISGGETLLLDGEAQ